MTEPVTLSTDAATLRVSPRGAEAQSWRIGGRELLWNAAPPWPRHAPVLFPIVGRVRGGIIRVDGRPYPIGTHGFAAAEMFSLCGQDATSATFTLAESPATLRQFPFRFRLGIGYRLTATTVTVELTVHNPGGVAMPYAVGLHPGFRWPFAAPDRSGHAIVFEHDEAPTVPVIDPSGLFSAMTRRVNFDGGRLPLDDALLADEALCFLGARSRWVRFAAPTGAALVVETEGFPHLALWSRPPAPFLSIESWTGHGDPVGFDGELAEKPSMQLLAPGASSRHTVRWLFEPPTA